MAREINRLSTLKVKKLLKDRPVGRHADGNGLYLSISANGGARWVYLYRGKPKANEKPKLKEKGLGSALLVDLADARSSAGKVRDQVTAGLDPIAEGRKQAPTVLTFKHYAESLLETLNPTWKNPKHRDQWRSTLLTYAYPVLGDLPYNEITRLQVEQVVDPIWKDKQETARRVRGRIEKVLDWAADRSGDDHFQKPKQPLSNMAMAAVLDRMGRSDITVHGFRSTFRDWASERTSFPNEVVEMALAHTITDKTEAAYRRGDLFDKRRRLMEEWERYCNSSPIVSASVTTM